MTQKEIARQLNLSKSTVSMALSGSPLVSEETRRRVLEAARRHNYRTNMAARSITSGRSMSVGIMAPTIIHPHNAKLVSGLQMRLLRAGLLGLYYPIIDRYDYKNALDALLGRRVDGIIAVATSSEMIEEIKREHVPAVFFDTGNITADAVNFDERQSGLLAVSHLYELGHRRIAFAGMFNNGAMPCDRFRGFNDGLMAFRLIKRDEYVKALLPEQGKASITQGCRVMTELLDLPEPPTGVIFYNDQMAIGAMRAIAEKGLRVPHDISLIGHDDSDESEYLPVPLTTISVQIDIITEKLTALLLQRLAEKDKVAGTPLHIRVEPTLIIRASTGPAKAGSAGS